MDKINEQFSRVKRWLNRLGEISQGRDHTRESEYYEDVLYAFFQNCFHLKDWLINSGVVTRNVVNEFMESNTDMKICRDLCNGSKHLTISDPSIDPSINVKRREYSLTLGGGPARIEVVYWIHADGRIINAYDLAANCVVLWSGFLNSKGLLEENFSTTQDATTKVNIKGKANIIKP